jgi:asparagine synthase (glutamine-hydrolysing)
VLSIYNKERQLLLQWPLKQNPNHLEFRASRIDLLSQCKKEDRILLFYGYLDMDWHSYDSPAEYLINRFPQGLKENLHQLFGSFIIIGFENNSYWIANDAMGDFLPSYYQSDNTLIVSDFADQIISSENCDKNDLRLSHFFASSQPTHNISYFSSIKQLKGGEKLTWAKNTTSVSTYYQPEIDVEYQRDDPKYWAERLKKTLMQAISYQCDGQKEVNVQLSGGLDSSLVMAMAKELGLEIKTHSYVFPNIPESDESLWIDSMSRMELRMNRFVGESHWPLKYPWPVSGNSPLMNPYRHLKQTIYKQVANQPSKFIITGVFADHLYSGYIYWLKDALRKNTVYGIKNFIESIKKFGLKPSLQQISSSKWRKKISSSSPFLHPERLSQINDDLSEKKIQHCHPLQYQLVFGGFTAQSCHFENEWAHKNKVHIRHPFRDRRVVELLMQIPAWILGDVFNHKKLARTAGQDLLPDSVLRRTKITTLKPLFVKGVLNKEFSRVQALLKSSDCDWQDYIQTDVIDNILNAPESQQPDSHLLMLWQCISYELWKKRLKSLTT